MINIKIYQICHNLIITYFVTLTSPKKSHLCLIYRTGGSMTLRTHKISKSGKILLLSFICLHFCQLPKRIELNKQTLTDQNQNAHAGKSRGGQNKSKTENQTEPNGYRFFGYRFRFRFLFSSHFGYRFGFFKKIIG